MIDVCFFYRRGARRRGYFDDPVGRSVGRRGAFADRDSSFGDTRVHQRRVVERAREGRERGARVAMDSGDDVRWD